ncbi:MAG: sulfurtransferase [Candidatus Jordarchaeum sp.]|uniref:sulfurtransferase n=1 Tax=Candidatus Jordarchaeum sp. TaxID=2823881 RepID=UPI00404A6D18
MSRKYPYGKGVVKLVSTKWLKAHLKDRDLMILDTQPNIHDYIQEHVPGAVYINEGLFREPLKGIPGKYVNPDAIQSVFRRLGIKADVPVVVYTGTGPFKGWGDGLEQTMVAYSLARFGHNNVHVLDGGIDKWKQEGYPITKVFPKVEDSTFKVKVRREFYLEYDEFKRMKDREDVLLLDARPPNVYEGQGPWIKPGHIPGAVNLPWASLMDEKNKRLLKPDKEVQAILKNSGVSPDKTIICSCGTGREATNEFLLLKMYLGYPNVKIYEGSFTEWTSYPENPTVVGKNPR